MREEAFLTRHLRVVEARRARERRVAPLREGEPRAVRREGETREMERRVVPDRAADVPRVFHRARHAGAELVAQRVDRIEQRPVHVRDAAPRQGILRAGVRVARALQRRA